MATIICQGLQSCLHEPQPVEPRALRLKLSSSIPHNLFQATPLELGFKSFFSSSNNGCQQQNPSPSTQVYTKSASSSVTRLNEKSLELCTENLGNETGTIFIENTIFDKKVDEDFVKGDQETKHGRSLGCKKPASVVHSFPPPLTTISGGSESLQVRPHREEGRLILKAVKSPLTQTCFQAERNNGRLRLCFSKDLFFGSNSDLLVPQTAANQEDIEANGDEGHENEGYESDGDDVEQEMGDVISKVGLGEQEKGGSLCNLIDELEENRMQFKGEEEMDKFGRLIRKCKEGGEQEKKELRNFEPYNWVAT